MFSLNNWFCFYFMYFVVFFVIVTNCEDTIVCHLVLQIYLQGHRRVYRIVFQKKKKNEIVLICFLEKFALMKMSAFSEAYFSILLKCVCVCVILLISGIAYGQQLKEFT